MTFIGLCCIYKNRAPLRMNACYVWFRAQRVALMLLLAPFVFPPWAVAQVSTSVSSLLPTEATKNTSCTIQADLIRGEQVEAVHLLYRSFGASEWTRLEMDLLGNTAYATIPPHDVLQPYVEFYLVLVHRSGLLETHPLGDSDDPFSSPPARTLFLTVRDIEEVPQQVTFLSPDAFGIVPADELVIAVSLLRVDTIVVRRATQIFLDGADVTPQAVFSGDIIVVAPENFGVQLRPGSHRITVRLFNREGRLHHVAALSFTVVGEGGASEVRSRGFKYAGSAQIESRHEQASGTSTWYNRGTIQGSGRVEEWRFASQVFVTSEERASRQPQNRYFISAESPWLKAGYGDSYPAFPGLILNGKRVRGLTTSLKLDYFNLDLALGSTARGIEGALQKVIPLAMLAQEQMADPAAAYAPIDSTTWGKFSYGIYERDLFAVRPSVGSGRTWQLGFTWLKSKDDLGSIRYGTRPQENIVAGADLLLRFDNNRIQIMGQGAFSAFNSDISSGSFTDERIDTLFKDEGERRDARRARDVLGSLITVNENLAPLSFRKLSTLAYDGTLTLNYLDNSLRIGYVYRGNAYNSFGQTFLRKDIRGVNIIDRVRLVSNQLLATIGYERLQDNTGDIKPATTTFTNLNLALSYYPRHVFPSITLGVASFVASNGLHDTASTAIDDATLRFLVQSSYTLEGEFKHTLSLNLATSSRDDATRRQLDVSNVTIGSGIATRWSSAFQSGVDVAVNLNDLPAPTGTLNYTTLSLHARYTFFKQPVTLLATLTPTFGDFKRTGLDLGSQWSALPTMTVILQFSYFNNQSGSDDTIWSLRVRYDI